MPLVLVSNLEQLIVVAAYSVLHRFRIGLKVFLTLLKNQLGCGRGMISGEREKTVMLARSSQTFRRYAKHQNVRVNPPPFKRNPTKKKRRSSTLGHCHSLGLGIRLFSARSLQLSGSGNV